MTYYKLSKAETGYVAVQVYLRMVKAVFYKELSYGNNFTAGAYCDFARTVRIDDPVLAAEVVSYESLHDVPENLRQSIFDKITPIVKKWMVEKPPDRTWNDP